jgi:lysine 6-dehydrogenase
MNILVVGIGLQGRAVVHDLVHRAPQHAVTAADVDVGAVRGALDSLGCGRAIAVQLDASQEASLAQAMSGMDLVVCMAPPSFQLGVARAALHAGAHFVSTSYAGQVADLDAESRSRGVVMLPEIGLDPGIDLVMARAVVAEFDEVVGLRMYGGGIPEPEAADNPLRYRITWTFDGVLNAYRRPARLLKDGNEKSIDGEQIFQAANIHTIDIPGLGPLEAYPNGDALKYASLYGLGPSLRDLGRFAVRWPGHSAFWSVMASLGFLRDEPIEIEGARVAPMKFVAGLLEPQLQFERTQRDLAVLRVQAWGRKNGREHEVVLDLIDKRDLETGLFAMNRTVGYSASIAAQMILNGEIPEPGVRSPSRDVPVGRFFEELRARGMMLQTQEPSRIATAFGNARTTEPQP